MHDLKQWFSTFSGPSRGKTIFKSFVPVNICFVVNCPGNSTELYRINRERHRFLGNEAESQQRFVAFAAPSSGQS
jgi:hypothetical protein